MTLTLVTVAKIPGLVWDMIDIKNDRTWHWTKGFVVKGSHQPFGQKIHLWTARQTLE